MEMVDKLRVLYMNKSYKNTKVESAIEWVPDWSDVGIAWRRIFKEAGEIQDSMGGE
jgi:hypothetical protein